MIAHVTMATRNVSKTADFFSYTLNWQSIERPGNIGRPAAWLAVPPNQELHLIEVPDFQISPFEHEFGRHVAVAPPLSDFVALKSRLRESGAKLLEPERETPFQRFFFREPNGYIFEVVEADHESET